LPTLKQRANASFGREAKTTIGIQVRYERGAEVGYYTGRIYCGYLFKLQTEEKVLTKS
jgi:hypothetical protein